MPTQRLLPRASFTLILAALIATVSVGLALAASAQPQAPAELLANPGFEDPFSQLCCDPTTGSPLDVFVASGWNAWWLTPDGVNFPTSCPDEPSTPCKPYVVPVYRNAQPQNPGEPPRSISGNAQKWGANYAVYVAGVYQRVSNIAPGTRLRFSARMQSFNCSSNLACYGGEGEYGKSFEPGENLTRVGIDPTGGTDPFSANIVWSLYQNPIDVFLLHQVETAAQADSVTVFVWSAPQLPRLHITTFVDDASLTTAGPGGAPATATSTLPPGAVQPTAIPPSGAPVTYTVQAGDTLYNIAIQFNLTLDQLVALNTLDPNALLQIGQVLIVGGAAGAATPTAPPPPAATLPPVTSGAPITYTVVENDTLFGIAIQFNLTLDQLLALNDITRDTLLQVGQTLTVGVATLTPTAAPTATPTARSVATPTPRPSPTPSTASLCLTAFDDGDGDGARGAAEPLLAGVQFGVKGADGASAARYTSNGQDEPHCLNDLPEGRYTVDVTPPADRRATSETQWSVGLRAGDTFDVTFGSQAAAAPEPTAAPAVDTPQAAAAEPTGSSVPIGAIAGIVLIVVAAGALIIGLRARRG